ncbi:glycosyltransferase [Bowmanella sp. Y57]|uniref:Glycosyltransferase n=2 Tax=Bowmanella yangjiangensis TaxID=2811230 RepID=A0ABS3CTL1_9ALTE|nr:glycosyltransferase [Bowmanella yangjiangensis]MBN7820458.1 glycosyltransferase [Bowmanella yangjiangensis]
MAVYQEDRAEWVAQAIDSILDQTYRDFILVVVVDGPLPSAISSFLREKEQRNAQLVVLLGAENLGLSSCMNEVIDRCADLSPKYLFRMDADDISSTERLSKQVSFFEHHPEVSVLGTSLVEINEAGVEVGGRKLPLSHQEILEFLPKRCSMNHPTVAFRYRVFEQGFRYRKELKNTQDYFLWIELMHAGYIFENLSERLLKFRRVNDFYKRRGFNKSVNEFRARWMAMNRLKRYSLSNVLYALSVLALRIMPAKVVKLAYKLDRLILDKLVKH